MGSSSDLTGATALRRRLPLWVAAALAALALPLALFGYRAWSDGRVHLEPAPRQPNNAPFITTPQDIVDRMLALAELEENDVVYDLGCGDGRIVITAARKYGCRGIGFEYDAVIAAKARENVRNAGVEHLVEIQQRDIFTLEVEELNRASVITLYLLPWMNERLQPKLEQLVPGKVIVSHDWDLPGTVPDHLEEIDSQHDDVSTLHQIFVWRTPLKKR
jgi:SAM-dependent methyltransferase